MVYDYDYVRKYNPRLAVGDELIMDNAKYYITEVKYECSVDAVTTATYTAEPIEFRAHFINDVYSNCFMDPMYPFKPRFVSFSSVLDLTVPYAIEDDNAWPEEEISDEQRNEFMKLLE